ncbi:MAG: inositol monophosphatase [Bacteroidales bacterium]|nr:inositol monophosphatase [Bacteroidales bacterium]
MESFYKKTCGQMIEVAREAGAFIRESKLKLKSSDIEVKGLHNFVTYVDKQSEMLIVERLKDIIKDAGFVVEENTVSGLAEKYNWIVDPLDGTTNFIHGLPCFSVSIALMEDERIVAGVVYEINQDECFYAWEGGGAWLNGKAIKVSDAYSLKDSLVATGFPYYDYERLEAYMKLFTWCIRNTHGVRRIGSAAVDLAYVACGRFEGFFEYSLNAWDVAAGALLVKEAGGRVSDFDGGENYIFGKEIVASNAFVFNEFIDKVKEVFKTD